MSKIDENRFKRAEIENFLSVKQYTNLQDQNLFNNESKLYFRDLDKENAGDNSSLQGPISINDLYKIN